jgi:periplasmic copper chaperone A
MNVRRACLGLILSFIAAPAFAAAPAACLPTLEQGWIRAAPPGATALAGYGVLKNACGEPFIVADVRAPDFAMAMIHETRVENGISRMRHARSLVAPARGRLAFAPGGNHMMLMHPKRALKEGDRVKVEIVLKDGRRLPAILVVRREAPAKP